MFRNMATPCAIETSYRVVDRITVPPDAFMAIDAQPGDTIPALRRAVTCGTTIEFSYDVNGDWTILVCRPWSADYGCHLVLSRMALEKILTEYESKEGKSVKLSESTKQNTTLNKMKAQHFALYK